MRGFWRLLYEILLSSLLLNISYGSKGPFFFEREPEDVVAVTGKNIIFHCKANASGKDIIYLWKFNETFIHRNNNNRFRLSHGSLQIFNILGERHSGTYECIAFSKDHGAIKSRNAELQTAYFFRETNPKPLQYTIRTAPYLLRAPKYKAFPAPTFVWKLRIADKTLDVPKDFFVTSQGDLLIPAIKRSHDTHFKLLTYHLTKDNTTADTALIRLKYIQDPGNCPDPSMISFETVMNKTVHEGSNVSFDCLAVAKVCGNPISIKWTNKVTHKKYLPEKSRRLVLNNVTREDNEGTYECKAALGGTTATKNISYFLKVIEKPKLVKGVSLKVDLPANGTLNPAVYKNTASFSWYKDGYVINNSSLLFDVFANGNLRIKNPSPAFSGIYQMFYENQAGTEVVSQIVHVDNKVGCGWKLINSNGTVSYNKETNSSNHVTCTWLFQVPTTNSIQVNITVFNFQTAQRNMTLLSFYDGSTASGAPFAKYHLNATTPFLVANSSGPFMTMILHATDSNYGGFTLSYWSRPRQRVHTTSSTTTKRLVTSTNATTKPRTGETTWSKTTKTTPRRRTATTGISGTVFVPTKKPKSKGGSSVGAIVGGICGFFILLALILLCIYRNKVARKFGLKKLKEQRSSPSNTDSQEPYRDNVPKMRPYVPAMSDGGPVESLVEVNPCYESAGNYGTEAAAAPSIYEVIGEDTKNIKTTGRNIPPPRKTPPNHTKAPSRPSEPLYAEVREEFNPLYESAEGLTGKTGLILPLKHQKNPAPCNLIPMKEVKGIKPPPMPAPNPTHYSYDDDELLYAEPFDSLNQK